MEPEEYEREVELIDYIEVLLRKKWLIVSVTVLCGLVAGLYTVTSRRQYESQALLVVSQPIASTRAAEGEESAGAPGTEIRVTGLAAETYEALSKGDELIRSLRDSLLHMEELDPETRDYLRQTGFETVSEMLTAELVEETQDADSPLLAFHVQSGVEALPVPLVNLWSELFMERHRGLSSNVADSYYQWVEAQYETARGNVRDTEDQLRDLTTAYGELSVLETEIGIKTDRLDTALTQYQSLEAALDGQKRELAFIRQQLRETELAGEWIGYADLEALPSRREAVRGTPLRQQLVLLRWEREDAVRDSLEQQARHESRRREYEARRRNQLLAFERETGIERQRRRVTELDSTLSAFRQEAVQLDQQIKQTGLDLEVYGKNLKLEPRVNLVAKAVVDEELWEEAVGRKGLDEAVQEDLGRYRLVSESVNPTYQQLSEQLRRMQIRYDRATTRIGFMEVEIPVLEEELGGVRTRLDSLAELESQVLHQLDRERVALEDSLRREARPVLENLALKQSSLQAQRDEYIRLRQREEDLSQQINALEAQVGFERGDFERWKEQLREQGLRADSLDRARRTLEQEKEVYQKTFDRFSSLLEEARIAREQAAGDIQIVSRAVVARPVPRGTVKKTAIAMIVGLMASVMLAFLLEYVERARGAPPAATPPRPGDG